MPCAQRVQPFGALSHLVRREVAIGYAVGHNLISSSQHEAIAPPMLTKISGRLGNAEAAR
jgi:hypothetical protein